MTSSPAPDLDELERLLEAGWRRGPWGVKPLGDDQDAEPVVALATALVLAAPALLAELRAARAAVAESGRLREATLHEAIEAVRRANTAGGSCKSHAIGAIRALLATPPAPSACLIDSGYGHKCARENGHGWPHANADSSVTWATPTPPAPSDHGASGEREHRIGPPHWEPGCAQDEWVNRCLGCTALWPCKYARLAAPSVPPEETT